MRGGVASRVVLALAVLAGGGLAACAGRGDGEGPADGAVDPTSSTTSGSAAAGRLDESAVLTSDGLWPLRLGMTVAEARAATGRQLPYTPPDPGRGNHCGVLGLAIPDVEVVLPLADPGPERIVQISTTNPAVATDTGLHVGSTAAEVRRVHPGAEAGGSNFRAALRVPAGAAGTLAFQFDLELDQPITDVAVVESIAARRNEDVGTDELCA